MGTSSELLIEPPKKRGRKKDTSKQRRAKLWKKQGLCIACGKKPPAPGLVCCFGCYDKRANYKAQMTGALLEMHLCIQCREPIAEVNPRTGKRFTRCAKCRKYQAKRRFGYYTNEKTKLLAEHKCLVCKAEVEEINEKTGKPFQTCPTCRDLRRVLNKGYINAKKGAS